jgi:hypothetical protein
VIMVSAISSSDGSLVLHVSFSLADMNLNIDFSCC